VQEVWHERNLTRYDKGNAFAGVTRAGHRRIVWAKRGLCQQQHRV